MFDGFCLFYNPNLDARTLYFTFDCCQALGSSLSPPGQFRPTPGIFGYNRHQLYLKALGTLPAKGGLIYPTFPEITAEFIPHVNPVNKSLQVL